MRDTVDVIASFKKTGEAAPLYVKIAKKEKEITLKVVDFKNQYDSDNIINRFSRAALCYRCSASYKDKIIEFTLEFHKSSTTWYITASNSTIDNLFRYCKL